MIEPSSTSDTQQQLEAACFALLVFAICKLVAYVVWRKDAVSDRLIIAFVHGQATVRGPCTWICLNKIDARIEVDSGRWRKAPTTNKEPKEATKWRPLREFIDANTESISSVQAQAIIQFRSEIIIKYDHQKFGPLSGPRGYSSHGIPTTRTSPQQTYCFSQHIPTINQSI